MYTCIIKQGGDFTISGSADNTVSKRNTKWLLLILCLSWRVKNSRTVQMKNNLKQGHKNRREPISFLRIYPLHIVRASVLETIVKTRDTPLSLRLLIFPSLKRSPQARTHWDAHTGPSLQDKQGEADSMWANSFSHWMSPHPHQKWVPTGQWNIWMCPPALSARLSCYAQGTLSFTVSTSILFISHQESTNYTIFIQSRLKTTVTRSQALFAFAEEINIKTKVLKNDHHEAALNQFFSKSLCTFFTIASQLSQFPEITR